MTLNNDSEIKGTSVTLQKVKKWVCTITTSKAKSLDKKGLGWYNWLGIAQFGQSNMKHP